ncbi:MAG: flavodoxin domain-containing protein [Candidatus Thiodiazotropha sp. (ex Notomyrtea botanica)]|nr:flavodoxin domain-containing protein [Candidatus Thiodiazotropha sp. (ex Notomyrtea botanica)]
MQIAAETVANIPASPLSGLQISRLQQALEGLTPDQLNWASGYLAGQGAVLPAAQPVANDSPVMTILYATHGGNARNVAETLADKATKHGYTSRLVSAESYRPRDLSKERLLIVVISTQGEGEPPESAREIFKFLEGKNTTSLAGLQYAIFGLGDSSYEYFCQAAKDLDRLLQLRNANNLVARVDADVDFETRESEWNQTVLKRVEQVIPADQARIIPLQQPHTSVRYDRNHPYQAEVLEKRRITTEDAVSEIDHLVLEVDPGSIRYQPGDALGLFFRNDPTQIDEILSRTSLSGDTDVSLHGETLPLSTALSERLELTQLHPTVVSAWTSLSDNPELIAINKDKDKLRHFCHERQFIDLLTAYPVDVDAEGLVNLLHRQQPRLYSIASSQATYEDEIHLTVSALQYKAHGRQRLGGASGYLTRRIDEGDSLEIYVAENTNFRLPADEKTPIIMIGVGTGVAPYRAFLQERESRGTTGQNWLLFGNRHFHRDFLYQTDWLAYHKAGLLDRISVAFSRDYEDRAYVQNRLSDEGAEIYRWLQEGAHLYVCGGLNMEKAVSQSLKEIIHLHGRVDEESATEQFESLRTQGRYLRDVY